MRKFILYTLYCLLFFHPLSNLEASDSQTEYSYQLSICSIFRDEARFLKEWIEFHLLVGVEHFYLFNHLSKDDYLFVLQPYIDAGIVELYDWPYELFKPYDFDIHQINAYRHCLAKVQGVVKWLALIDTDEYLIPVKENTLLPILERFLDQGGLTVNWVLFGTSRVKKIPDSLLMIESLLMKGKCRASQDTRIKSIVRPERVRLIDNVHYVYYHSLYHSVDETGREIEGQMSNNDMPMDHIRINHYWTRDEDFFLNHKLNRRVKNLGQDIKDILRCAENLNKETDTIILRFAMPLRKRVFH
jgi:Glycosyltransferase family 92